MKSLLLVSLVWALAVQSVSAQGGGSDQPANRPFGNRIVPFLEGTDVLKDHHVKETIFEARIAPHLILWQNLTDVITLDGVPSRGSRRPSYAFSLSATPAVVLRMYREVSSPVRTPSYMPRVTFQMLWAPGVQRAREHRSGTVNLLEMHWMVGHHSNGQDGCFYAEQFRQGTDCTLREDTPFITVPRPVTADSQGRQRFPPGSDKVFQTTINKKDGSFSTNYARVGINWRRNAIDRATMSAIRELTIGWNFQVHFKTDENMLGSYPTARTSLRAAYATRGSSKHGWLCGARQDIQIESHALLEHRPETVWPASLSLQATCYPRLQGANWGLFARSTFEIPFSHSNRRVPVPLHTA
jgi:hypothetical protein